MTATNLSTRNFLSALFAPVAGTEGQVVEISGWTGGGKLDDGEDIPKGPTETVYIDLGAELWLDEICAHADRMAAAGKNVYFGCAPRFRTQPKGKRSRNEDVDRLPAVWVDLDCPKDDLGQYVQPEAWKKKTAQKLADHIRVQASARVTSGHGFHLYWFFKEPLTDLDRGKALLGNIIDDLGGDTASRNVSRLLRLPGPPNVKRPDKPVDTGVPELRSEMRFDVEFLEEQWKPAPKKETPASTGLGGEEPPKEKGRRLYEKDKRRILDVWGSGNRHEPAIAVVGAARKAGWAESEAREMVRALAEEGGGDLRDLLGVVKSTYAKPIEEVEGWALLRTLGFDDDELKSIQSPAKKAKIRSDLIFDDIHNATLFTRDHGENLRYAKDSEGWFKWDGKRWDGGAKAEVEALGITTARAMLKAAQALEARTGQEVADKEKTLEWAEYSQSYRARQHMLRTASPMLLIHTSQLDTHPHLLNVANGTLNLRTGELVPHKRDDFISKIANVEFDPKAEAPLWEKFCGDVFCVDPADGVDLLNYVQVAAGYSLTGYTDEQCFFFMHGTGRNGKGTFIETLKLLLGDLAQTAPIETFLARQFDRGIPVDIAMLRGARLVSASEPDEGARFSEGLVKQLTGQDEVSARFMRENYFTFKPHFKLWFNGNHKPKIRGSDEGIWRRVKLIPFKAKFEGEKRDMKLQEKLRAELPGILRWAVDGARRWFEKGALPDSRIVNAATQDYRSEEDVLGRFLLSDVIVRTPGVRTAAKALFDAFIQWCERERETAGANWSGVKFGREMRSRGVGSIEGKGANYYPDVGLAAADGKDRDWQQRRLGSDA